MRRLLLVVLLLFVAPLVFLARRGLKSEPTPFVVGAKPTVVRAR